MSESVEKLTRMYELGAKKLNELLDELKWRKLDVADEEKELTSMKEADPPASSDDIESQEIVVRSGRMVLENEIKEAEELDAELERVKAEIEKISEAEAKRPEKGED